MSREREREKRKKRERRVFSFFPVEVGFFFVRLALGREERRESFFSEALSLSLSFFAATVRGQR